MDRGRHTKMDYPLLFSLEPGRMQKVKIWYAILLFGFVCITVNAAPDSPLRASALEVRNMAPQDAAREHWVHLHGVVTFYDPAYDVGFLFQDTTAAIFVSLGNGTVELSEATNLLVGDEVEIEGVTEQGDYLPKILAKHIRILGRTAMPAPGHFNYEQLASGKEDSDWIEVEGVVRSAMPIADDRASLNIMVDGQRLTAQVQHLNASNAQELICATVRIQGICRTRFNTKRQICAPYLSVTSLSNIVTVVPAPSEIHEVRLSNLAQFDIADFYGQRVKVQGTVTGQDGESLFIQDGNTGLHVQTVQPESVTPGDIVEVTGFPVLGQFTPALEDAVCRVIGHHSEPAPVQVNSEELSSGDYNNVLVRLKTQLAGRIEEGNQQILILGTSNVILNARLDSIKADSRYLALQNGSELELTGICVAQSVVQSAANWDLAQQKPPDAFQLQLRSPNDVVVVRNPPWWTLSRLFWALAIISAVLVAGFAWVFELNRKVRQQMVTIEQKVEQEAVFEERSRIAREFHDTLEQELVAVTIQLESADSQFDIAPNNARRMFEMARNMARHTLFDARRSVWDLRSHLLENSNLVGALSAVVQMAKTNARQIAFSVESEGIPRKLSLPVENNLLRIAQEAIANAVKHARATQIAIHLDYTPEKISLRVIDDGIGFDHRNRSCLYGGHFGLQDMTERAVKMGAPFDVISAPGQGTEIRIEIREKQDFTQTTPSAPVLEKLPAVCPPQL